VDPSLYFAVFEAACCEFLTIRGQSEAPLSGVG
jgi:hypothetical protein